MRNKKVEMTEKGQNELLLFKVKRNILFLSKKQYFERTENLLLKNVSKETYFSLGFFLTTCNYLYLVLKPPQILFDSDTDQMWKWVMRAFSTSVIKVI